MNNRIGNIRVNRRTHIPPRRGPPPPKAHKSHHNSPHRGPPPTRVRRSPHIPPHRSPPSPPPPPPPPPPPAPEHNHSINSASTSSAASWLPVVINRAVSPNSLRSSNSLRSHEIDPLEDAELEEALAMLTLSIELDEQNNTQEAVIRKRHNGLSEEDIGRCLITRSGDGAASTTEEEGICIVCQDSLSQEKGTMIGELKCGHEFHDSCIKKWLLQKNNCPLCKSVALEKVD